LENKKSQSFDYLGLLNVAASEVSSYEQDLLGQFLISKDAPSNFYI
jgi:hypothetical protein